MRSRLTVRETGPERCSPQISVVEVEMVISNHQISPDQNRISLQLILRINPVFAGIVQKGIPQKLSSADSLPPTSQNYAEFPDQSKRCRVSLNNGSYRSINVPSSCSRNSETAKVGSRTTIRSTPQSEREGSGSTERRNLWSQPWSKSSCPKAPYCGA